MIQQFGRAVANLGDLLVQGLAIQQALGLPLHRSNESSQLVGERDDTFLDGLLFVRGHVRTFDQFAFMASAIARRSAASSGVTSPGKNPRTRPSLPMTYLAKFHAGRWPLAPRYE